MFPTTKACNQRCMNQFLPYTEKNAVSGKATKNEIFNYLLFYSIEEIY